jgi:uncharacterized membrane protein
VPIWAARRFFISIPHAFTYNRYWNKGGIEMTEKHEQTSSIPQGIAGLLAYFIPFFGGLFFLIIEKENRLIRFHAVQSILLWIVFVVLSIVFLWIPVINILVGIFMLAVWLLSMYQALMERMYELPIIGGISKRQTFGKDEREKDTTAEEEETKE